MSEETIKCDTRNIRPIIEEQIELLGNEADLNHLDVSGVTDMRWMFEESKFNGDISKWDLTNVDIIDWSPDDARFKKDTMSNNSIVWLAVGGFLLYLLF